MNRVKNFKPFVAIGIFLYYPCLIFSIIGLFLIPISLTYIKESIAFGLFSFLFFGISLLFSNGKTQKYVTLFSFFLLASVAFIKLSFYYLYGVRISSSAFFVIFETNAMEASEFFNAYINFNVIGILILLFMPLFLLLRRPVFSSVFLFFNNIISVCKIPKQLKFIPLLIIISSILIIIWKFKEENFLITSVSSYQEYKRTKEVVKQSLAQPFSNYLKVTSSKKEPQTYVVIIGESTSRWHLQLYGYQRETNPLLSEIKKELFVFDSVITPHVHTILALDKILTLSDNNEAHKKENGSIIQLANQSGFTTFWLSNQRPVGINESIPTLIGNAATHKYFIATDDYTDTIYDENLFSDLDNILKDKAEKKIIFIHLIGTHGTYDKRYPEKFDYFNSEIINTKFSHQKAKETTSEYDNAVRYNDFIVRNIIEKVKKEKLNSYVLYFSDHGDEVFDTMDFQGHDEYHATRPMFEIPFIVWLSNEYKIKNPEFIKNPFTTSRRYSLEHFIHSFSDISNIKFKGYDASKSIFNLSFKKRTRWIKKEIDYDNRN